MKRRAFASLLCIVLAACGGGGSPSAQPPSAGPTTQQLKAAQSAKLTATFNTANNQATLAWSDTFPAGTSYSIEQQASNGSWSPVDAVPGSGGTGAILTWIRAINSATSLRVAVTESGYSVLLQTPSGNTSVKVTPPAAVPSITLNQSQPVSGNVMLSIGGGGIYSEVQWSVDLTSIGSSTAEPGYSVVLNAGALTTGPHLILAQLESSPDLYFQIRQTIQVQNPEVTVNSSVSGTSGTVYLTVAATSASGIVSVSATLDGSSLGTLTAPNCIAPGCSSITYQFAISATAAGSGAHAIGVHATDGNGVSASQTSQVVFDNSPSLALTTPFDGELVNGTLNIAGAFATDKQGVTVSVAATLGSVTVLNATDSPFSGNFSLTGVNPGTYTLTVVATDSDGLSTKVTESVTVTSSPSLVYTPVLTLGSTGSLLAVSSTNILYRDSNNSIHVHTPSSDTIISQVTLTNPSHFQLTDSGYTFADATSTDRPGGSESVYMWAPGAMSPTNISTAAGSHSVYDQLLAVHFPWVLWASFETTAWSQYTLYNVSTAQNITVLAPAGATVGNYQCDFATINGSLTLFFWIDHNSSLNVYSWSQASGTTTQLSSDGNSVYPQTDGTSVAWQTLKNGPLTPPYSLSVENVATHAAVTLSTSMAGFQLNSGVLGWVEATFSSSGGFSTTTAQAIKAWNGTAITSLSTMLSSAFIGSSGGYVAYEQSGQLYDWSPAGGSVLLFNAVPGQALLAGSTIYFTNGASQAVFAVPMH